MVLGGVKDIRDMREFYIIMFSILASVFGLALVITMIYYRCNYKNFGNYTLVIDSETQGA